jgi:hypothetical protein
VGTTTLGDWNDIMNAVAVMGVQNFQSLFVMNENNDVFVVTLNDDFRRFGDSYLVSYFLGTSARSGYREFASSLTDGVSAIVVGATSNFNLPILGKITAFKMLDGIGNLALFILFNLNYEFQITLSR